MLSFFIVSGNDASIYIEFDHYRTLFFTTMEVKKNRKRSHLMIELPYIDSSDISLQFPQALSDKYTVSIEESKNIFSSLPIVVPANTPIRFEEDDSFKMILKRGHQLMQSSSAGWMCTFKEGVEPIIKLKQCDKNLVIVIKIQDCYKIANIFKTAESKRARIVTKKGYEEANISKMKRGQPYVESKYMKIIEKVSLNYYDACLPMTIYGKKKGIKKEAIWEKVVVIDNKLWPSIQYEGQTYTSPHRLVEVMLNDYHSKGFDLLKYKCNGNYKKLSKLMTAYNRNLKALPTRDTLIQNDQGQFTGYYMPLPSCKPDTKIDEIYVKTI